MAGSGRSAATCRNPSGRRPCVGDADLGGRALGTALVGKHASEWAAADRSDVANAIGGSGSARTRMRFCKREARQAPGWPGGRPPRRWTPPSGNAVARGRRCMRPVTPEAAATTPQLRFTGHRERRVRAGSTPVADGEAVSCTIGAPGSSRTTSKRRSGQSLLRSSLRACAVLCPSVTSLAWG